MILAVVGSRGINDKELMKLWIDNVRKLYPEIDTIVSGGANGPDLYSKDYAKENNIKHIEHLPNWDKWGNVAGMLRNGIIIRDADIVLAFWDGFSKGTKNIIDLSRNKGAQVIVVIPEHKYI